MLAAKAATIGSVGSTWEAWETTSDAVIPFPLFKTLAHLLKLLFHLFWNVFEVEGRHPTWETTPSRAVVGKAGETTWKTAPSRAVIAEAGETSFGHSRETALGSSRETAKTERLLAQVVTRSRHVQCEFLDGEVLLILDAPAAVARGDDVQGSLARQQQFVLGPEGCRLVVGGIFAGSDGECVFCVKTPTGADLSLTVAFVVADVGTVSEVLSYVGTEVSAGFLLHPLAMSAMTMMMQMMRIATNARNM